MKSIINLLFAAAIALPMTAFADHTPDHHPAHDKGSKKFAAADADNDGTLDREEAKKLPHVSKHFEEIDADKDGTVDRDEVHNFMKDHKGKK